MLTGSNLKKTNVLDVLQDVLNVSMANALNVFLSLPWPKTQLDPMFVNKSVELHVQLAIKINALLVK